MNNQKKVKTRFAPSPTGYLHVGSLRTALYDYLVAKKERGKFVLRIEDTDQKRLVEGAVEDLIKILQRVNLFYDEGPFLKDGKIEERGDSAPYIQSKRLPIYQKYVKQLITKNQAYYCFCTKERIEKMKEEQKEKKALVRYDGKCRNLSTKEIKEKLKANTPYVIRLKVPREGVTSFTDFVYGQITYKNINIDDQVLLKSDGFPTYHLAVVVDDYLMGITHVIRGEEWLPSTPKHILLYNAFGWMPPYFVHLPLILNEDRSKMSKRKGNVAVEYYLAEGYLPEALLNFILLLGWNPKTNREIFSLQEMTKNFDLKKINKSGAIFDLKKLNSINSYYIKKLSIDDFAMRSLPYLVNKGLLVKSNSQYKIIATQEIIGFNKLKVILSLEQQRVDKLSQVGDSIKYLFSDKFDYDKNLLTWKQMAKAQIKESLMFSKNIINGISDNKFDKKYLESIFLEKIKKQGKFNVGETLWPLRVALTGEKKSPSPFELIEVLGKNKALDRINNALDKIK